MKSNELSLGLPDHGVKTKQGKAGPMVFDPFRRKWLALTPEEWVRQHFLNHLVKDLGCPASLISVEHSLVLNSMAKRADIVIHGDYGIPIAVVECKAPTVAISQATFEQAARYNLVSKVRYLFITNGLKSYCCVVDHEQGKVRFLDHLPNFRTLNDK